MGWNIGPSRRAAHRRHFRFFIDLTREAISTANKRWGQNSGNVKKKNRNTPKYYQ
jgi:hypothetical protein